MTNNHSDPIYGIIHDAVVSIIDAVEAPAALTARDTAEFATQLHTAILECLTTYFKGFQAGLNWQEAVKK